MTDTSPSRVVLVVDDDVTALETYRYMLTAAGFGVRVAETAEAGVTEAKASRPDAVLLDLHLPAADGVECLRQIQAALPAAVPAAILTGDYFLDEAVAAEIDQLGVRIHFKPVWEDDLLQIVADLLAGRLASADRR